MRVSEQGKAAMFLKDLPNGNLLVICQCQDDCPEPKETFELDMCDDNPTYCKICKQEVCYRPWCEW